MKLQLIIQAFVICCIVGNGANKLAFSQVSGLLELVKTPGVSEDLNLDDDQRLAIDMVMVERKKFGSDFASRYRTASPEEQVQMTTKLKADYARIESDVTKTLLPHQIERLKQIRMQMIVQTDQSAFGLNRREFIDALALTDKQKAEIGARALEVNKAVAEKIKKLKAEIEKLQLEARDDVIKTLTPEQRKKYLEMVGRPFQPDQAN